MEKVVKEKKNKKAETVETVDVVRKEDKEVKNSTIITSRVLFVSVLDKIYLVCLLLLLFGGTIGILGSYNSFWAGIGNEILFLIIMVIVYFFYNWLYKCVSKTMLCLTKKEVYKESYVPFVRHESSIPLNKITGVSAVNYFWIFRLLIIHQYQRMPLVFWTWTNQEFKDELDKLVTTSDVKDKPINDNIDKDIIAKDKMKKTLSYIGIALAALIVLFGLGKMISYFSSPERTVKGTYILNDKKIVLNGDKTCNINDVIDYNITECEWVYDKDNKEVRISYEYKYENYYGNMYEKSSTVTLDYNSSNKSITTGSETFTRK